MEHWLKGSQQHRKRSSSWIIILFITPEARTAQGCLRLQGPPPLAALCGHASWASKPGWCGEALYGAPSVVAERWFVSPCAADAYPCWTHPPSWQETRRRGSWRQRRPGRTLEQPNPPDKTKPGLPGVLAGGRQGAAGTQPGSRSSSSDSLSSRRCPAPHPGRPHRHLRGQPGSSRPPRPRPLRSRRLTSRRRCGNCRRRCPS